MAPIIAAILPTILKGLASPIVASTAASFVAKKFGLSDSTVGGIANFLNGLKPDDQIKIKELDYEFQKFMRERSVQLELAEIGLLNSQIEVNREEAKHTSLFIAGWRPFIGWACGFALIYCAILEPILRFSAQVFFGYKGGFPTIDTNLTMQVLLGILGLAGMRSFEKTKGAEGNR